MAGFWLKFHDSIPDLIGFDIYYFGYISGTLHVIFSQGQKTISNAVKYRTTWDQLVAYYINIKASE